MIQRFNQFVEEVLKSSGWYSGRRLVDQVRDWEVSLESSDGFKLFRAAEVALLEFGGLKIKQWRSDRTRVDYLMDLRPVLAEKESDRFAIYSKPLGVQLYPLGEAYGAHGYLAIDPDGKVYMLMDGIWLVGTNIDEALGKLIQGQKIQNITPRTSE